MIRRSVVEKVPDDLESGLFGGFEHLASSSTNRNCRAIVRSDASAGHREESRNPAACTADNPAPRLVVPGRANQVEPNAVAAAMRRTFEASLEEAGEFSANRVAHGGHQCAKFEMEPFRSPNQAERAVNRAASRFTLGTIPGLKL